MKQHTQKPEGLNIEEVARVLKCVCDTAEIGKRIERISEQFLGRSYGAGLLGGGPDLDEVFRVSLDSFDCVNYMETVLALGLAGTVDEFVDTIRRIRYTGGRVDWSHRNHYMIDWARNNEKQGY